jgi:hypothetical protein
MESPCQKNIPEKVVKDEDCEISQRGSEVQVHDQVIFSNLIKNYEIKLRGKWTFPVLPFPTREYFICHEGDSTIIGARLKTGKSRREMLKIMIDFQEAISSEMSENMPLKVDQQPILFSKPRWGSIMKCHPTAKSLLEERRRSRRKKDLSSDDLLSGPFHTIVKSYRSERCEPGYM